MKTGTRHLKTGNLISVNLECYDARCRTPALHTIRILAREGRKSIILKDYIYNRGMMDVFKDWNFLNRAAAASAMLANMGDISDEEYRFIRRCAAISNADARKEGADSAFSAFKAINNALFEFISNANSNVRPSEVSLGILGMTSALKKAAHVAGGSMDKMTLAALDAFNDTLADIYKEALMIGSNDEEAFIMFAQGTMCITQTFSSFAGHSQFKSRRFAGMDSTLLNLGGMMEAADNKYSPFQASAIYLISLNALHGFYDKIKEIDEDMYEFADVADSAILALLSLADELNGIMPMDDAWSEDRFKTMLGIQFGGLAFLREFARRVYEVDTVNASKEDIAKGLLDEIKAHLDMHNDKKYFDFYMWALALLSYGFIIGISECFSDGLERAIEGTGMTDYNDMLRGAGG